MNFGLATLLVLPAAGCAQERHSAGSTAPGSNTLRRTRQAEERPGERAESDSEAGRRRLESVTWDSVKHQLTWVISQGDRKDGASYKPKATESYVINMDDATMTFSGETRRFSKEEAANVHVLMDLISKYAVDSTVWWDDGQGEPVNGDGKTPAKPKRKMPRNSDSDDNVATLHVSALKAAEASALSALELDMRITSMEQKLTRLKQLREAMATEADVARF